jgi:hypothetical protein
MAGIRRMTFNDHIVACLVVEATGEIKRNTKEHNFLYKQEGRYYKLVHPDSDKDNKVKVTPLNTQELQELMRIRYFREKKERIDKSNEALKGMAKLTDNLKKASDLMGDKTIFEIMDERVKLLGDVNVLIDIIKKEALVKAGLMKKIKELKELNSEDKKAEIEILEKELEQNGKILAGLFVKVEEYKAKLKE